MTSLECVCARALTDSVNEPKCYFSIKVRVYETPLRSVPGTAEVWTSSKACISSSHPCPTSLLFCSIFTSVRSAQKCLERPYVPEKTLGSQTHSWQLTSELFPLQSSADPAEGSTTMTLALRLIEIYIYNVYHIGFIQIFYIYHTYTYLYGKKCI